ncbi:uncharacterized protein LOC135078285 [Ostrinia nubilalis]|uniref:uncharacterized protein LOC135078285 n=1 Tax=Ostrinia nubilalis TaxID=29057 RepID=UPI0030825729
MTSLAEHITKCNTRLDEYENKLIATEERLHVLEEKSVTINSLQNTITILREQQRSQAQASLRNEVEILGINEITNENPVHIALVISQKIGLPLSDADLDFAKRVGPLRRSKDDPSTGDPTGDQPRPLVVRFLRRHQRDEFLKVAKTKRKLTCSDIEVPGTPRSLYFNERLTHENRQLFRSARHRCKGSGFKYCWTKTGTVYIRKQDGKPAIAIKTMEDLLRHVNPND